ncbi:hypothetical protein GGI23_002100 [Coemansia sp. RSA 2559]|nr:hypothetical protein GGI23_002100 [Coemansia sp. RSA 2559]
MSSEEDLKRQIQALESAITKYKGSGNPEKPHLRYSQVSKSRPYNRYNPIRPPVNFRPKPRSRNLKLVVKGEDAAREQYIRTANTLTKVGIAGDTRRTTAKPLRRRVVIDGEEYMYKGGGNKLVRASTPQMKPQPQTKQNRRVVSIDGVDYVRTKKGGLVRVDALRLRGNRPNPVRKRLCTRYVSGRCEMEDNECKYSHKPTPETVPMCVHFQRGSCTNPDCLFVHATVNPNAPICRNFIFKGFCEKGSKCPHRHVWECPDWVEKGKCARRKCKWPHPTPKQQSKGKQVAETDTVEDERASQRYTQRPVFGKQKDDESADSSGSELSDDDSIDEDVSNDEAEELLKWYDDAFAEPPAQAEQP